MAPKFPVAIAILMGIAVSTIGAAVADPLVFVSRQIPSNGSIYFNCVFKGFTGEYVG